MRNTNYMQLALDLRRGQWLIHAPEVHLPMALDFLSRTPVTVEALRPYQVSEMLRDQITDSGKKVQRSVLIVPLHGVMTKYDTCDNYGTTTIAARMLAKLDDPKVAGVILDIDSGGGAANSVAPLLEAIRKIQAAGKPIVAHCDSVFSAAYWVASQCDAIFLDNRMSGAGSIGAYASILDDRVDNHTGFKIIDIYAPESADKNKAYREALDGKPEAMQKELSELVSFFHNDVKAGRKNLKADAEGVLSGATFKAKKSVQLGLADGIKTLDEVVENVMIRAEYA